MDSMCRRKRVPCVSNVKASYTGKYLKHVLHKGRKQRVGQRVAS